MEKENPAKQTLDQLHERRKQVVRLHKKGIKIMAIARMTGLSYLMHRLFIGEHDQTGMALVKQTLHDPMFWTAVAVGLLAQAIDGALGMAYGITSSSFLLAAGAPACHDQWRCSFGRGIYYRGVWRVALADG